MLFPDYVRSPVTLFFALRLEIVFSTCYAKQCATPGCNRIKHLFGNVSRPRSCSWRVSTSSALVDDVGAATVAGIKGKLWATFVPAEAPAEGQRPRGASVVARDFQTVALYGSDGAFVGVRRPGSGKPIEVRYMLVEGTLKTAWRACMRRPRNAQASAR